MKKLFLFLIIVVTFSSCKKQDNELENVVLFNPYEPSNGFELMVIDSIQKYYGSLPNLKAFFHVSETVAADSARIERVIVYRDGVEYARLSPTNFYFFADITTQPGATYNYQLAFLMKDLSITKSTKPYIVLF